MFAVPGWSVPASALKTQNHEASKPVKASGGTANAPTPEVTENAGKKRKRNNGVSKASDVNSANLADLWETVIEGKSKPKKSKKDKDSGDKVSEQPQKVTEEEHGEPAGAVEEGTETPKIKKAHKGERPAKLKTLKEKKREMKAKLLGNQDESPKEPPTQVEVMPLPSPKPVAKLTPLQASMRQKLISARFRHLNQTLYTTPSSHSLELFAENPEMFQEYHEGFRRQVEVWPENPVDSYIQQIRLRGSIRGPPKQKNKVLEAEGAGVAPVLPLPRTDGTSYIADLGCGDAGLSQGLEKEKKKLKVQIFSYDLQSPSPHVTKADIANLPLKDDSVDVAIFCLALMGTNWIDFIEEAFRIIRWKGELWVAEIKSRFGRVSGGKGGGRVEHSVGNRKRQPENKKAIKKAEEDADDADLLVAVDGHDDNKGVTDVSAFVEVLRKRGFVLQSEKAVDLSNRMFVKMCFVKGLTPMKGKCVPVPKGMAEETWKPKRPKAKFIDEDEVPVSSEAGVLKPCVYKLR